MRCRAPIHVEREPGLVCASRRRSPPGDMPFPADSTGASRPNLNRLAVVPDEPQPRHARCDVSAPSRGSSRSSMLFCQAAIRVRSASSQATGNCADMENGASGSSSGCVLHLHRAKPASQTASHRSARRSALRARAASPALLRARPRTPRRNLPAQSLHLRRPAPSARLNRLPARAIPFRAPAARAAYPGCCRPSPAAWCCGRRRRARRSPSA